MTHEQAIAKLESDIRLRGMSKHTLMEYRDRTRLFLRYINKPIEALSETDFRIYLEYLDRNTNLASATINNYNSAAFFL